MRKKTYHVDNLRDKVNGMILHSQDDDIAGRESLIVLIESVLMDTGNYEGFAYLNKRAMGNSKNGTTVGINDIDADLDPNCERFKDTDHTRVVFFS